jgi:hypothetical protein
VVLAPAEDTLGLIASAPEHYLDCFRLIRPGERYYQGKDNTVLCPTCHGSLLIGEEFGTVTTASGLAVDYGGWVDQGALGWGGYSVETAGGEAFGGFVGGRGKLSPPHLAERPEGKRRGRELAGDVSGEQTVGAVSP